MSTSTLGMMDTAFLAVYSVSLFISGSMGDHLNPKLLLIVPYIFVTGIVVSIALAAYNGVTSTFLFGFLFAINGFF